MTSKLPRSSNSPAVAVCIGCGCDDNHACDEGCGWIELDRVVGVGICNGHAVTDQMREAYKRLRPHLRRLLK